jgi:hypothetical protein
LFLLKKIAAKEPKSIHPSVQDSASSACFLHLHARTPASSDQSIVVDPPAAASRRHGFQRRYPLHPEVPPAKSIQQQEQVQQDTAAFYQPQGVESEHGGDFIFNIEDINFYVDKSMLRDEPEQGLQQPIAEPETAVQGQRGAQSEHEEFITR